jgi:uncharacterized protein YaaQ
VVEGDSTPTKLCVLVVSNNDADRLMRALVERQIAATKIASSGGFLQRGNATIFTGVTEAQVEEVLEVVRNECRARREYVPIETLPFDPSAGVNVAPVEVRAGGAIAFVLDVDRFERL